MGRRPRHSPAGRGGSLTHMCPQPSHLSQSPSVLTFRSLSSDFVFFPEVGISRLNQDMNHLTLARVWMAPQGRKCTVDLFGQHGPRQFVR